MYRKIKSPTQRRFRLLTSSIAAGVLALTAMTAPAIAANSTEINEDFSTGNVQVPPQGWTVESSASAAGMKAGWQGWTFHTISDITASWGTGGNQNGFTKGSGNVAIVQSDSNRPSTDTSVKFSSTLWSPTMDLTQHTGAVKLTFDSQYRQGQAPQSAKVVASFDGGNPVDIEQFTANRLNESVTLNFDAPTGANTVKVGWAYLESSNNWYWMIDNVALSETAPANTDPVFISAAKPIAHAGDTLTVTVGSLRQGQQPTYALGDATPTSVGVPAADATGTSTFSVPVPSTQAAGIVKLTIAGEGINPTEQSVTIFDAASTAFNSTEPRLWFDGMEDFSTWQSTSTAGNAWESDSITSIIDKYGADRRQAFTRANGLVAHVEASSATNSTLTSQEIAVTPGSALEVRVDSHLRIRGAASQTATVTATFNNGDSVELLSESVNSRESEQLRLPVTIPAGATGMTLVFHYVSDAAAGSWTLDNAYVTKPLAALATNATPAATVDIISDVQGSNTAMCTQSLPGFQKLTPRASTLVVNGDLVSSSATSNYDGYFNALNGCGRSNYALNISTIGNHEYYATDNPAAAKEKFLDRTDMRGIGGQGGLWGETMVDGQLPVLWIGSEYYDYSSLTGNGPFFEMSDAQYEWLSARLAYWRSQNMPVLLFSHQVFPYSVSATYIKFNAKDYGADEARLSALLQENPNVALVTSHTHWSVTLNDWNAEKHFDPSAEYGINIFNSGATTTQYGPSGDWNETGVGGHDPSGLRATLFGDRLRLTAYEFSTTGPVEIKHIDVPRPVSATATLESPEVSVGAVTDTTIAASWNAVEGATKYVVSYSSAAGTQSVEVTDPQVVLSGLSPETAYTLSVVAANDTEASAPSAPIVVTTTPVPVRASVFFQDVITRAVVENVVKVATADQALAGDWDGDGVDTLVLRNGTEYTFLGANASDASETTVDLGAGIPVVGDFNGDGKDDIALRAVDSNLFSLTYNVGGAIPAGVVDTTVHFGKAADKPLAGDWDGDGKATFGVQRDGKFLLTNTLTAGNADVSFTYGRPDDRAVVGDFNGDGKDTIAVSRGFSVYVKNTLTKGDADLMVNFGRATDMLVAGDWTNHGSDTLAAVRNP